MAAFETYLDFLGQIGKTLEQLTELEKQKAAAVRADDLRSVDACMRREQALSLSLRSMDIKREKMLSELGLRGVRLSGLIEHCPEKYRLQTKEAVETLHRQFAVYQGAAEVARTTLECNLHELEKLIGSKTSAAAPPRPTGGMTDIRA